MVTIFKRTWKLMVLLIAAAAIPACAGRDTRPEPSSPHGNQAPSGPTPGP